VTTRSCLSCFRLVLLLALLLIGVRAFAATGQTVHTFANLANGATPFSGLIGDAAGNLYGTTWAGGTHGYGAVFKLSPNSSGGYTETIIYSFAGVPDGANPSANLTFDSAGNLYGTTSAGGSTVNFCNGGCGTVFKLTPDTHGKWKETLLYAFTGTSGSQPSYGVVFDAQGNLYGTTSYTTFSNGYGVIYKLSPADQTWTETTLYTFTGRFDGGCPSGTPIFDSGGNLYGTDWCSVGNVNGVVYELSPGPSGWTFKVIHSFTGGDGAQPASNLLMDSEGNLFGTTDEGGYYDNGTVFELSPSPRGTWTIKQLYYFHNYGDGAYPLGTIAFDSAGNLYGTTQLGGPSDNGTVFQLTPNSSGSWTEHILTNFNGANGSEPDGGVYVDSLGNVYATAFSGASLACQIPGENRTPSGCGTVVKLSPASGGTWLVTTILSFTATDSSFPQGSLIADSFGNYYGTATLGGAYGAGEVYKLTLANGKWAKTALYDFTGSNGDGIYPSGSLVFDKSGNLYGTTQFGGLSGDAGYCSNGYSGCGVVFELSPQASGSWKETILYSFNAATAGQPMAGLVFDHAGNLYGTTYSGGGSDCPLSCGAVFELSPGAGGWTEATLYEFTGGSDGSNPQGGVVVDNAGNLYGTASSGGTAGSGTAFELSPGSGVWSFSVIHEFGAKAGDAADPTSGLIFDSAGNLYGTAYFSPSSGGAVYRLSRASGSWDSVILYSFKGGSDGSSPYGGVTFDATGNLYGTTTSGGKKSCSYGCGAVFSLTPSGSGWNNTVLHYFTGSDGENPQSGVTLNGGNIFVTTPAGGSGNQGTVFEITP
jgi:uncharacterized repeat protein (TIGR03803 family)